MKRKRNIIITFIVCSMLLSATVAMFFLSKEKFENDEDIQAVSNENQQDDIQCDDNAEKIDTSFSKIDEDTKEQNYIVEENQSVDLTYFDDAVFIGNSRTQGLMLYGGITNAKFYADKGLVINKVNEKPITIMGETNKDTVMNALKRNKFNKYYIMLGTNELGWAYENIFVKNYQELIDDIKEINPDATIYLQSILPVSKEKSDSDEVYNNANIENYNDLVKNLAKENNIYYVNVAEYFKDDDGNLDSDASSDGIHLKAEYCKKWTEYLLVHTIRSNYQQNQDIQDGVEIQNTYTNNTDENNTKEI